MVKGKQRLVLKDELVGSGCAVMNLSQWAVPNLSVGIFYYTFHAARFLMVCISNFTSLVCEICSIIVNFACWV